MSEENYLGNSDATTFLPDQIESIVFDVIEGKLNDKIYNEKDVDSWVNSICEDSMSELYNLQKPFKYIIQCMIVQRNGAGLHCGQSTFWDCANDNLCTVKWPSEKARNDKARMHCIVQVYGLSLFQQQHLKEANAD